MDGSHKLPVWLLGAIRERLAAGADPQAATLGVAARMRYVAAGTADDGSPLTLDHPLAGRLLEAMGHASTPATVVASLLGVTEVFGDLGEDSEFRGLVTGHLETLTRHGAVAARAVAGP